MSYSIEQSLEAILLESSNADIVNDVIDETKEEHKTSVYNTDVIENEYGYIEVILLFC